MEANIEKGTKVCSRCGQEKPLSEFIQVASPRMVTDLNA